MTERMVQRIIKDYQERLREMPYVPQTSFRRNSLGFCGDANKLSLAFLFSDHAIGLQFLKDVGLIRSKLQCNSCGRDMAWHAAPRSLHVCGEVQCTRRFTLHSVPCNCRIHRLVIFDWEKRNVHVFLWVIEWQKCTNRSWLALLLHL